jgi:uncharacterized membrane protein
MQRLVPLTKPAVATPQEEERTMNKFMVIVFEKEAKAFEGVSALNRLHGDGSITLYAATVVERQADGKLSIKRREEEGPLGTGVGILVGGLIGVFGGPIGMAIGASAGALTGMTRDLIHGEISDEFLEGVTEKLTPGKFAVVAELAEEWVAPVDVRMAELGGQVLRELRQDFVPDQIEKRTTARRNEWEQRKQEHAGARAEKMAARLQEEVADAERKLQKVAEKARKRLDDTKQEMEAKLRALEEQAAKATPEVKQRIEQRIAETRHDLVAREQVLTRAFQMAEQAIHA